MRVPTIAPYSSITRVLRLCEWNITPRPHTRGTEEDERKKGTK